MLEPTELEKALADFRECAKRVQGNLHATPLDRLTNPWGIYMANFIRSAGELAVTGIEELSRAASRYLDAQNAAARAAESNARAVKWMTVVIAISTVAYSAVTIWYYLHH